MNDDRLQYTASFIASFSFNFRQVTACTSGIENYFLYKTFWNLYKSSKTSREISPNTSFFLIFHAFLPFTAFTHPEFYKMYLYTVVIQRTFRSSSESM